VLCLLGAGEQEAFEQVNGAELEPAVVHGLEDLPAVPLVVGLDADQADAVQQPVVEVRQRLAGQFGRELLFQVAVPFPQVPDGRGVVGLELVRPAVHEGIEQRRPLGDVDRVPPLAVHDVADQRLQLAGLAEGVLVHQQVADEDQQQVQRGDPLLAIHQVRDIAIREGDVRPEEIRVVPAGVPAVVQRVPLDAESAVQVLDQAADVLTAPGVLPLVIVQLVPVPVEQLVDGAAPALDRRARH
jgi:hypothetical protein